MCLENGFSMSTLIGRTSRERTWLFVRTERQAVGGLTRAGTTTDSRCPANMTGICLGTAGLLGLTHAPRQTEMLEEGVQETRCRLVTVENRRCSDRTGRNLWEQLQKNEVSRLLLATLSRQPNSIEIQFQICFSFVRNK